MVPQVMSRAAYSVWENPKSGGNTWMARVPAFSPRRMTAAWRKHSATVA